MLPVRGLSRSNQRRFCAASGSGVLRRRFATRPKATWQGIVSAALARRSISRNALESLVTVVGAAAVVAGACVLVNPSLASSEGAARADRRLASHGTQRIAFDVTGKDDLGVIYIMRTDGSGLRGLGYYGDHPALSPDGRRIVFTGEYPGGVFVAPLDGHGRRLVPGTKDIYFGGARWSPDGRSVVVGSDGDLVIYLVGGGKPRYLNDRAYAEDPDSSPDGKRIAYSAI